MCPIQVYRIIQGSNTFCQVTHMVQHFIESDWFGVNFSACAPPVHSFSFRPCAPPGAKEPLAGPGGAEPGWVWACPGKAAAGPVPHWPHHRSTHNLLGSSKSSTSAGHTHAGQGGPAHRKHIQCLGGSLTKHTSSCGSATRRATQH